MLEEKIAKVTAIKGNNRDGNTQLEVSEALVPFLDLAHRVDNQAISEGSRDDLVSSSSEYVKSDFC